MNWKKLGFIYCASGENELKMSYGRTPAAIHLKDNNFRIFYGTCDAQKRSSIFYMDVTIDEKVNILYNADKPVLKFPSMLGTYDDNGLAPSCALIYDNKLYLYLIGFSIKNKFTFDTSGGVAISEDMGLTFKKFSGPFLTWSIYDPIFASSPWVLHHNGIWHLWYVSGERWEEKGNARRHYYNIKHKISEDGISFTSVPTVSIDFANEYEYALARPSVIFEDNIFKMWYCFRAQKNIQTYRMGYAESKDGEKWKRMDEEMKSFDVSKEGWDSEMVCYPYMFKWNNTLYMLYNGNHFGESGFGLAVLKK
ncbi:MAG: hypothetical protein IJU76_08240 [Desulfovibrionaceae bacterium]|nr:hypothetical protein [Desulfovibrionaceae bacterium]